MSWYVKTLLLEREVIRSNIYNYRDDGRTIGLYEQEYLIVNLEDATYDDLLIVEFKIKELMTNNTLNYEEQRVLNMVLTYPSFSDILRNEDISRPTLTKRFNNVCNRVAYHLGGYFTDEGYVVRLADKHSLNEEQISKLKEIMKI